MSKLTTYLASYPNTNQFANDTNLNRLEALGFYFVGFSYFEAAI